VYTEELFIAGILSGGQCNEMEGLSGEELTEAYSWEHLSDYLEVITPDGGRRKLFSIL
jgi:hypothetical protein